MTEKPRETQAESHVVELKEKVNNSSLMKHRGAYGQNETRLLHLLHRAAANILDADSTTVGVQELSHGLPTRGCVGRATKRLCGIEGICIPWHYLFERTIFVHKTRESIEADYDDTVQSVGVRHTVAPIPPEGGEREAARRSGWNAPTVDDLNEDTGREFDRIGVAETTAEDLERLLAETDEGWRIAQHDREQLHDRGICRMIVMDVRNERGSL